MLKMLNLLILTLFMLVGTCIPFTDAKGLSIQFEDTEEQSLSSQVFEEEVHLSQDDSETLISVVDTSYSFPLHINLTPQLVYSDDHKPPLYC